MPITHMFEKPHFTTNTQYTGVPSYGEEPSPGLSSDYYDHHNSSLPPGQINLQTHPQMKGHRSWLKTFLIQGFCLLWIGPIALLLYLNVTGYIIGASAWCPGGNCQPRVFDPVTSIPQVLIAKHDHESHNLLGALQLVAKVLEIWFIMIASWMVYLITMFLAGRKRGLPVAYIMRPIEFSELSGLLDPLLWRTLPKPFSINGPKKARLRVWIFVFFTVGLGIICNLMGPATAVLVLPTLQWLETDPYHDGVFQSQNSANQPAFNNYMQRTTDCTQENFANEQWSCTAFPYSTMLDAWLQSYTASQEAWNGITQQDSVSFAFNSTAWVAEDGKISDFLSWAPSRRSMGWLSIDLDMVRLISQGADKALLNMTTAENSNFYDSYTECNNTVSSIIQRNGPVTGIASNMWLGYDNLTWWDAVLEEDAGVVTKAIRCYENYDVANTPLSRGALTGTFTKCVQWGSAWDNYNYGTFTIEGIYRSFNQALGPSATFDIWTSDKAAFLPNGNLPANFAADCLPRGGTVPADLNCDWDAFFAVDSTSDMATRSNLVNTIQISAQYQPEKGHPTSVDLMFDFVAFSNFTMYSLDASPISNPLYLATTPDLPMSGTAVPVNPAWTLAAWSADNGGTIGANRSASLTVLQALDRFWDVQMYTSPDPVLAYRPYVDYIALIPIIQTLSMVDYDYDTDTTAAFSAEHPRLVRNARINVWAYGLSSRTSYLGVLIAVVGVGVVIVHFFLGILDRRPYRSPTELLVAALEHSPSEEFRDRDHDETAIARTPFRVEDVAMGSASNFRFQRSV